MIPAHPSRPVDDVAVDHLPVNGLAVDHLAARLARDLVEPLAALGLSGAARPTPWGVEYGGAVVATALPPSLLLQRWRDLDVGVIAASPTLQAALARMDVAALGHDDGPLVALPDGSLHPGEHHSAVVRCDDPPGPPNSGELAIGAFLLCWALDAPQGRLVLGDPATAAQAASLGCGSEPAGPPPVLALCSGMAPCPPPLVVDALAAGIPVTGWRTPALADVVGDAGLLVEAEDGIPALAAAIAALVGDPRLAAEVGGRGPRQVETLDPAVGLRRCAEALGTLAGMARA